MSPTPPARLSRGSFGDRESTRARGACSRGRRRLCGRSAARQRHPWSRRRARRGRTAARVSAARGSARGPPPTYGPLLRKTPGLSSETPVRFQLPIRTCISSNALSRARVPWLFSRPRSIVHSSSLDALVSTVSTSNSKSQASLSFWTLLPRLAPNPPVYHDAHGSATSSASKPGPPSATSFEHAARNAPRHSYRTSPVNPSLVPQVEVRSLSLSLSLSRKAAKTWQRKTEKKKEKKKQTRTQTFSLAERERERERESVRTRGPVPRERHHERLVPRFDARGFVEASQLRLRKFMMRC